MALLVQNRKKYKMPTTLCSGEKNYNNKNIKKEKHLLNTVNWWENNADSLPKIPFISLLPSKTDGL